MEQIRITQLDEKTVKSCAFTGHRELPEYFSSKKLYTEIEELIKNGIEIFYNGMAIGFDLLSAEQVLKLKKKYKDVKLVACIPCYNQEKNFSPKDKKRYVEILKKADKQILLSEKYYKGCMQVRDQYMADNADVLVAFCEKETGGAAYTLKYFKKKYPDKKIVMI